VGARHAELHRQKNIEHYRRLLSQTVDPTVRVTLEKLLADEMAREQQQQRPQLPPQPKQRDV
jgi:hypothetical protein